jgi:hypothetical protein
MMLCIYACTIAMYANAQALGVNQILVAINKLDAAIPPWSIDRYNAVKDAVEPFLIQIGFKQNKVSCYLTLSYCTAYYIAHYCMCVSCGKQCTYYTLEYMLLRYCAYAVKSVVY